MPLLVLNKEPEPEIPTDFYFEVGDIVTAQDPNIIDYNAVGVVLEKVFVKYAPWQRLYWVLFHRTGERWPIGENRLKPLELS